ncbi:MAG: sugar phosphorylase, partial [Desulfomonilia bacterium]|nr:sugar phosphorylase [Desulfomonilia bacterium]
SDQTVFLNILDTHDGIGLMGVRGLLPEEDLQYIVETAQERGALISHKATPEGTEEPYEVNSTWWSAINPDEGDEPLDLQVRRYLASRSIALVLRGVPGIYIHGALGTSNDYAAFEASGVKRDVNRGVIDAEDVEEELLDPDSKLSLLFRYGIDQIRARRQERAFHPQGSQRILMLSPGVFAVLRGSPEGDEHILAVTGVTGEAFEIQVSLKDLGVDQTRWKDLLSDSEWNAEEGILSLTIRPYGVVWLKPSLH